MRLLSLIRWSTVLGVGASDQQQQQQQQFPLSPSVSPQYQADIPPIGFGTWNLKTDDHNASKAVEHAIKTGYKHIDCAAIYRNEPDVGRGIHDGLKAAGLQRQDIWITSKLWNTHHDIEDVSKALAQTLKDLKLDYLDLYLMHWPVADRDGEKSIDFVETWKAMESLLSTGQVRNIGVSNFNPVQLRHLLRHARVKPYAHQMELHPYLPQSAWLQYHREEGIRVTAYSPFGNANPTYDSSSRPASVLAQRKKQRTGGKNEDDIAERDMPTKLLEHPTIKRIAKERNCTPATVVLSWGLSRGTSVIPKSQHKERIEENLGLCYLWFEDIRAIQTIGMKNLTRFNNPSKGWGVPLYGGLQDS